MKFKVIIFTTILMGLFGIPFVEFLISIGGCKASSDVPNAENNIIESTRESQSLLLKDKTSNYKPCPARKRRAVLWLDPSLLPLTISEHDEHKSELLPFYKEKGSLTNQSKKHHGGGIGDEEIIILEEGFEGLWPPLWGDWEVYGDPTWDDDDYQHHNGGWACWCANGGDHGLDPEYNNYAHNMNAWMIYGPFDLSDPGIIRAYFTYWSKFEIEPNYDTLFVGVSRDGQWFYGNVFDGIQWSWTHHSQPNIMDFLGESEVWIGFAFRSDGSVNARGAWIDNILIRKNVVRIQLLSDGVVVTSDEDPGYYKYRQSWIFWSVVGVRPPSGTDVDLKLYDNSLFTDMLASSTYGGDKVDFIVGDYNHNSRPQYDYPEAYYFSGSGTYRIEWEDSNDQLIIHQPYNGYWFSHHVVKIWDVFLREGHFYTFSLHIGGPRDMGIALFKSNGDDYYAGRSDAEESSDRAGTYDEIISNYEAPRTDWYGFVVWSNDEEAGPYTIEFENEVDDLSSSGKPGEFTLMNNYPNPFNSVTVLKYDLPRKSVVNLTVYDLTGRLVTELVNEIQSAGYHSVTWDASGVASGVYFYRLQAGDFVQTKRMTLLK
jgi:hypothetical protein